MTAVDLDALDAARATATPGPWAQNSADPAYVIGQVSDDGEEYLDVADAGARSWTPHPDWKAAEADAALIVAAVNALPELLADARKLRALREALEALHTPADPCTCGGRRWVDDEGWSPEDYERNSPRTEGNGLIPCGFCNFGGWNTDQYEPGGLMCTCDEPAPCPTVRALAAALTSEGERE